MTAGVFNPSTAGDVLTSNGPGVVATYQPPSGGVGLASYFISPADLGLAHWVSIGGTSTVGDFTVGTGIQFTRACTWTGVRFSAEWAGPAKVWKARASIVSPDIPAELQSMVSGPLTPGTNTILWAAPIAIPGPGTGTIASRYTVSVYDMSGAGNIFAGYIPTSALLTADTIETILLGPSVWRFNCHLFVPGDGVFTSPSDGSTNTMAVEPLFTVP